MLNFCMPEILINRFAAHIFLSHVSLIPKESDFHSYLNVVYCSPL